MKRTPISPTVLLLDCGCSQFNCEHTGRPPIEYPKPRIKVPKDRLGKGGQRRSR